MATFFKSAAVILAVLVLCIRGGRAVRLLFADTDIKVSEDSTAARATVRVNEFTENVTMVVIPVTLSQYREQSDLYGTVCDSLINDNEVDPAEVEDFIPDPVEKTVSPLHASPNQRLHEFTIDVPLVDDDIQEPAEVFLLILAVKHPNSDTYSIRTNAARQCTRVDINADSDDFGVTFEPTITTVREDAGQVGVVRVTKLGRTEQTVMVSVHIVPGHEHVVEGLPTDVILTKDDTSVVVMATIIDNHLPADDTNVTLYGIANVTSYGQYRNLPLSVTFEILDNDYVGVGFVRTEISVVEGEEVFLTTRFTNNVTIQDFYRESFTVSTRLSKGNATAQKHYIDINTEHYVPGDPIKISTVDDDELERSRWFEVRLIDPSSNSLTRLEPNVAIVTILDNDGTPNRPSFGKVTFYRNDIIISWTIDKDELRPVKGYSLTIATTSLEEESTVAPGNRVARQDGRGTEVREVKLINVVCKFNPSTGEDVCESTVQEDAKVGTVYNLTLCAVNEFSSTCENYEETVTTLPPLLRPEGINRNESGLPFNTVIAIVIVVLVVVVLCCLVLICIAVYCLVTRRKRGKGQGSEGDTERHSRGTATPSLYSTSSVES